MNIELEKDLYVQRNIEKEKAKMNLYKHILYYDIPAFVTFVKIIKPKVVICFGNDATNLAQVIVDKCLSDMDLKVKYTEHFASLGSNEKGNNTFAQKGKELDDLIDSIKTDLNVKKSKVKFYFYELVSILILTDTKC